ncbi:substrate-binding domain-containing protein [Microbacterium sp.]|uniref:substrate-binding domain-containing protein n=1 Tax=Microbacterium sp. TaxID=51671 RepID=UPI00263409BE|nr:substrate-binding domain-containing protein [Microbacterium sp.]
MVERPKRVTIADVAAAAGVAQGTVSHALRDKGRVDPRTRKRIKAIAADLGYRPSVRAQRLRGGSSHTIALVTALPPSIVGEAARLDFFLELALPIAHACIDHGYSLVLVPPVEDPDHLATLDIDGAIVVDPLEHDSICTDLVQRGVRVVAVGDPGKGIVDGVVDRHDGGASLVVQHLRSQGARRIGALLSSERHTTARAVEMYLAGQPTGSADDVVTFTAPTAGGEDAGRRATLDALDRFPDLDAVYAPLDAFAVGAIRALTERGRAVPDDVLVATNYDGRRAAASDPPITALDLNLPGLAQSAVELLMDVLAGQPGGTMPAPDVRLRVRQSTQRTLPHADPDRGLA